MSELITLTIIFSERRPNQIQCLAEMVADVNHPQYGRHSNRDELESLVALPEDERRGVIEWLASFGMKVIDPPDGNKQLLFARATIERIKSAFGEETFCRMSGGGDHRGARVASALPRRLAGYVQKVSGLFDQRLQTENLIANSAALETAAAMARETGRLRQTVPLASPVPPDSLGGFTPAEIREIYQFPDKWDGRGETIALMLLGRDLRNADLETFWRADGVEGDRTSVKQVGGAKGGKANSLHGVGGGMTVEWVGAMAPGAKI